MKENTIIRIYETGEPEVMKYETLPVAEPGPGEIRLKVEAIGVGFGECLYRRGLYVQDGSDSLAHKSGAGVLKTSQSTCSLCGTIWRCGGNGDCPDDKSSSFFFWYVYACRRNPPATFLCIAYD